jgi:hypothetical protein
MLLNDTHWSTTCYKKALYSNIADSRREDSTQKEYLQGDFLSEKMKCPRFGNDLSAASYIEFATDVQDVLLDGVHTEDEVMGNLPVGSSIQEQLQDFAFTCCEQFCIRS